MPHATTRRTLIALAVALAAALPAHAIYKWVDEKGVTHFSDDPPPDGKKAQKIEPKVTPPSSDVRRTDNWKEREIEQRKKRIEQDQTDEYRKAKAQNAAAERKYRCNYARRELNTLEKQIPVYTLNDKGERVYMEDKDRPAEIAEWKRAVAQYCD